MLAINGTAEVQKKIVKFGISNDFSTAEVDISKYVSMGGIIPIIVLNEDEVESLTMVGLPGDERKDIDEVEKGMSDMGCGKLRNRAGTPLLPESENATVQPRANRKRPRYLS